MAPLDQALGYLVAMSFYAAELGKHEVCADKYAIFFGVFGREGRLLGHVEIKLMAQGF